MYAVVFDIDTEGLKEEYHIPSSTNAYGDIRKFMEANDFKWQQIADCCLHSSFSACTPVGMIHFFCLKPILSNKQILLLL
jgi:hypothetical protein